MTLMSNRVPVLPYVRPLLPIGGGFDTLNGAYLEGEYGQYILNGGKAQIVSIMGPGNSCKTSIAQYIDYAAMEHIPDADETINDTEDSYTWARVNALCAPFPRLSSITHGSDMLSDDEIKIIIVPASQMFGDEFFEAIKDVSEEKYKNKKTKVLTTPFVTVGKNPIKILAPTFAMIDSMSELDITSVSENILDKNNVGEAGMNMIHMRRNGAKKLMLTRFPNICAQGSMYITMTAHVGEEFDLGFMAPKKHKLTHSKKGVRAVGVPKAFDVINPLLYEIINAKKLDADNDTGGVLYPEIESDRVKGCIDLLCIDLVIIRNKNGATGSRISVVVSQREGVLPHLTQFHYLREMKHERENCFDGNNSTYSLVLVPDVKLSRTTARKISKENKRVQRALEIESEMLQVKYLWPTLPANLMCTPRELYNDLKDMGYDWDELLQTRNYWVFKEYFNDNPPELSVYDLLRMRAGFYVPYWYNPEFIKTTSGLLRSILDTFKPLNLTKKISEKHEHS